MTMRIKEVCSSIDEMNVNQWNETNYPKERDVATYICELWKTVKCLKNI